jgi:hypothetical protein
VGYSSGTPARISQDLARLRKGRLAERIVRAPHQCCRRRSRLAGECCCVLLETEHDVAVEEVAGACRPPPSRGQALEPARRTTGASPLPSAISDRRRAARWRGRCHPGVRRGSPSRFPVGAAAEPRPRPGNSWPCTAPLPGAAPRSSIAARASPATTRRRCWRCTAEPARSRVGAQPSRLNLYQVCAILSNARVRFRQQPLHRRATRNVNPKSPCCLPQDRQSPPC